MRCSILPPPGRRHLTVEVLEGRDCPAVSATLSDGTLLVTGDAEPDQVSVVELGDNVVAVFDRGVGFPPFAGVEAIVVETLGGDDRVEYGPRSPEAASRMGDRQLSIDVGAGDDVVILRDLEPEPSSVRGFTVTFQGRLNLGTGHDFVRAEVRHADEVNLDAFSEDDGDDVGVAVLPGIQRFPSTYFIAISRLDLAPGDNRVSVATQGVDDVEVQVNPSGRDGYTLSFHGAKTPSAIDGQSWFGLSSGAKNGGADDRITIDAGGFADVSTDIDTGAGNDWVNVEGKYLTLRPRPSDAPGHLAFDARLGDGDDRLQARFVGYADAQMNLDFGVGDDRAKVRHLAPWADESTRVPTSLSVDAQLGAGDDSFRLFARGYDLVHAAVNPGPAGDGRDDIVIRLYWRWNTGGGPRDLMTWQSADLDSVRVLGLGYPTADVHVRDYHKDWIEVNTSSSPLYR